MTGKSLEKLYVPMQPDFETEEGFVKKIVKTDSDLYGVVAMFYEFAPSGKKDNLMMMPDGCTDFIFKFHGKDARGYVYGNSLKLSWLDFSDCDFCFGFRLFPGALGNILRFSAKELQDGYTSLLYAVSNYDEMFDAMSESVSFAERIRLVERYFHNLIQADYKIPELVRYSVHQIIDSDGNASIQDICEQTGYSERYLRKIYEQYVGISPKALAEVVRFQKSLRYNLKDDRTDSLADVACQCGYYDQSQMNRVYRKFTGMSPVKLQKMVKRENCK